MKSTFFSSFLVLGRLRTIFRGHALVFSRSTVYFLSHSPILNPISGGFSMARHSFQPRTSISPRSVLYFPILRALLQEISPFIIATLLFSHSVKAFPIQFSLSPPSSTFLFSIDFISAPHPPPSSLPPPLSFSFLPTFPSPSPINARTRALSRNTRVRVRPHIPARQEVFVYNLHRFTTPRNLLCTNALGVKENKKKPSPKIQSPHNQYFNTKTPISSTVNFI